MPKTSRWVAAAGVIGVVGALGIGAAVGAVGSAGAASGSHPSTSTPVTTARFTFDVSVAGLTSSAVKITGSGQADFTDHAASLTVDLPANVAKLIPGGTSTPEVVKAILLKDTVYMDIPGLAPLVGKPWISVALPTTATGAVSTGFSKVASALGDVDSIVQFARTHHATVTPLTTSTIDGVTATGDKITASPAGKRVALTADLWADPSDRLVQADVQATVTTKKHRGTIGAELDVTGYGDPVTITAPPPAQVKAVPLSTVEAFLGTHLAAGRAAGAGHHGPFAHPGTAGLHGWAGQNAGHGHRWHGGLRAHHGVFGGLLHLAHQI